MKDTLKKTKVLLVITKSNFGGAQKYVYDIATSLPRERFDVVVATGGTGTLIQKLYDKDIRIIPIPSLTRDVSASSDISAFFNLLSIFRNEKPEVVHLNSAKAGGVGALAARIAGVPKIIFTAHGWAFNEERPKHQQLVIKFFSWVTMLLSHKTIAVSDAVRKDVASWPLTQKKIVVIKNGIAKPDFYSREAAREKLFSQINNDIPKDAYIVGTIAELHKNKGLTYAIEAFAKLLTKDPNLFYFILGGGEEYTSLNNLLRANNLHKNVFLLGFTDDAARFLPAFDAFILPSITEGLALVLLEAGLAGLPVVASQTGGIPEVIINGKTGILVPLRDPQSIMVALLKIHQNKTLATKLGTTLRGHVESSFSLEKNVAMIISLYTEN